MSRRIILIVGNLSPLISSQPFADFLERQMELAEAARATLRPDTYTLRCLHAPVDQDEVCCAELLQRNACACSLKNQSLNPRDLTKRGNAHERSRRTQSMTLRHRHRF